jgi:hypothetical protein
MPIVNFIPVKYDEKRNNEKLETYDCPVYKIVTRAGFLSTTGQSNNFFLPVELPSQQSPDHWILQDSNSIAAQRVIWNYFFYIIALSTKMSQKKDKERIRFCVLICESLFSDFDNISVPVE